VGLGFVGIECRQQGKHMQQVTVGFRLIVLSPEVNSRMVGTEHERLWVNGLNGTEENSNL
jgi:hypothetical protein